MASQWSKRLMNGGNSSKSKSTTIKNGASGSSSGSGSSSSQKSGSGSSNNTVHRGRNAISNGGLRKPIFGTGTDHDSRRRQRSDSRRSGTANRIRSSDRYWQDKAKIGHSRQHVGEPERFDQQLFDDMFQFVWRPASDQKRKRRSQTVVRSS